MHQNNTEDDHNRDRQTVQSAAGVREAMRREIISGRLAPGDRLPTHISLVERFGVSNVTVQSALNQLAGDGFIEIRPRIGSFVAARPPHLHNIGLVFPFDPAAGSERSNWSKYYQVLTQAAIDVQSELGRRLIAFHGVQSPTASGDRQRLLRHIERHQLAGIVFSNPPLTLENTPIVDAADLPRVELSSATSARWPVVRIAAQDWLSTALGRLADRGRRRVAILFNRLAKNELYKLPKLESLLAQHDIQCPPYWRQAAEWHDAMAANHCVQLLMRGRPDERPNALLITDDNLIESVVAGLLTSGVRVPEDVDVVARVNFPLSGEPVLPLELLGYDLRRLLRQAVELIDHQRRSEPVPRVVSVKAVWRKDLESESMAASAAQNPGA